MRFLTLLVLVGLTAASSVPIVIGDTLIGSPQLPMSYVVQRIPPAYGGYFGSGATMLPGLEVVYTLPIFNDPAASSLIHDYCAANLTSCETTPVQSLPIGQDPVLDNKEWFYISLWEVSTGKMILYAATSFGRENGEERSVERFRSSLPNAETRMNMWRSLLVSTIQSGSWTDLKALRLEVEWYTLLTGDVSVSGMLIQTLTTPCTERPSFERCRTCCDDNYDECGNGCEEAAVELGVVGCVGAGLFCFGGGPGAIAACCAGGGSLVYGGVSKKCYVNCGRARTGCRSDCDHKEWE